MTVKRGTDMWKPLNLVIGNTYKFTLGWGSSNLFQSIITGKVVNICTNLYSESVCVVNGDGIIYLWNVPNTRLDLKRVIHKVEPIV